MCLIIFDITGLKKQYRNQYFLDLEGLYEMTFTQLNHKTTFRGSATRNNIFLNGNPIKSKIGLHP
jgi:hypothetical protein